MQGLWLRRKAARLPGAPGPRQGVVGNGPDLHLLAIGDSIIEGVGTGHITRSLPVQFATALAERERRRVLWRVEGLSGHDIDDVLETLDTLESAVPPDRVLVSVGVNDVTGLSSTGHWRARVTELMDSFQVRWPRARVIFAGLPPMSRFPLPPQPLSFSLGLRAARLDRIAADVVSGYPRAIHVPTRIDPAEHHFCEDGFHPSAESCTLWASELAEIDARRTSA